MGSEASTWRPLPPTPLPARQSGARAHPTGQEPPLNIIRRSPASPRRIRGDIGGTLGLPGASRRKTTSARNLSDLGLDYLFSECSLNVPRTLNQRAVGSSPTAPTKMSLHFNALERPGHTTGPFAFPRPPEVPLCAPGAPQFGRGARADAIKPPERPNFTSNVGDVP